jgi:hypothetical protein
MITLQNINSYEPSNMESPALLTVIRQLIIDACDFQNLGKPQSISIPFPVDPGCHLTIELTYKGSILHYTFADDSFGIHSVQYENAILYANPAVAMTSLLTAIERMMVGKNPAGKGEAMPGQALALLRYMPNHYRTEYGFRVLESDEVKHDND